MALSQYLPNQSPARVRSVEQEPASNFSRLARLIGSSQIEAVYDPYLDDKGLGNLLILVRLANSASSSLRLITSRKEAERLSSSFITAFFTELGASSGEVRKTSSPRPHRRFMLLSRGRSLIMGMSLNDLNKNEAAHTETDVLDKAFFEAEWAASQPL